MGAAGGGDVSGRYLPAVAAGFCVALVLSNIIANKIIVVGPLTVAGAALLFPFTYWLDDVLTEVYGYAAARRVIWLGVALQLAAVGAIALAIAMPGAIPAQSAAFNAALALTFWIVLGSLVAYWCGEFVNSYILARLKLATGGRLLWTRTVSSTLVGQALDSALFPAIAFGIGSRVTGQPVPWATVWHIAWSIYVVKCAVEILLTPLTYAIVTALKRAEGQDVYDRRTNWNPFAVVA